MELKFKQGMYHLNPDPNFNFQLNRVILWNGGNLNDVMQSAKKITNSTSWKKEMIYLGDHALSQNRIPQAIAYYRMIGKEINELTNANSLTFRLFTEKENAGNHCNLGNAKLALDVILQWLTFLKHRDLEVRKN